MAKTVSGQLYLSKKEVGDLKTIIQHTLVDISFGGGGSYNLGDSDYSHDEKSAKRARNAIELIKFIVNCAIVK